jgi:hypothetical protein
MAIAFYHSPPNPNTVKLNNHSCSRRALASGWPENTARKGFYIFRFNTILARSRFSWGELLLGDKALLAFDVGKYCEFFA